MIYDGGTEKRCISISTPWSHRTTAFSLIGTSLGTTSIFSLVLLGEVHLTHPGFLTPD